MKLSYLVMFHGAVESDDSDEEEEDAGSDDAADDVQARDHVRRLAVSRDADQQKSYHLKIFLKFLKFIIWNQH